MKRLLVLAAAAAVAVVVVAVNATAGHKPDHGKGRDHHGGGKTIAVVERATTDAVTNGDTAHDLAGNILTFANDVYDKTNTTKVGIDQGSCTRIVVGKSWECAWTTFLPGGQITVEGPFLDTGNSTLAITGGTGAYRNARGQMDLKYRNPAGTEFDFVFHLIG